MKQYLKAAAGAVLGDYSLYRIYQTSHSSVGPDSPVQSLTQSDIVSSTDAYIAQQAWYGGEGSHCYAMLDGERIAAVCFYWFGDRYRSRGFWPLSPGEAKLVQIVTSPDYRGGGLAAKLIGGSARRMLDLGYTTLYARVWHSNDPSWRAFKRAGWRHVAWVAEVNPFRSRLPIRLCWRFRHAKTA